MPRKVKCCATGEYGLSDEFVKINGRYYKSQAVYEQDRRKKDTRKELVDYICREFLDYYDGQPFPPILVQKLKELAFYDSEIILETFRQKAKDIHYSLSAKRFDSDSARVSYMFAIVKNSIADVKRQFDYKTRQKAKSNQQINENVDINSPTANFAVQNMLNKYNIAGANTVKAARDISGWLEVDEI